MEGRESFQQPGTVWGMQGRSRLGVLVGHQPISKRQIEHQPCCSDAGVPGMSRLMHQLNIAEPLCNAFVMTATT